MTGREGLRLRACYGLVRMAAAAASLWACAGLAFEDEMRPLLDSSCMACHSNQVLSSLDLTQTGFDLSDTAAFRVWERVYDRVRRGEMPPAPMPAPPGEVLEPALGALKEALIEANLAARGPQRTPLRRLTRLEYRYTLADLLQIDVEHAAGLAEGLPAEADSGGFDTVAASQGISALHVRKYLDAADRALDLALDLGPRPEVQTFKVDYADSGYLNFMHDGEFLGAGVTMKVGDAVATFFDSASTYMFHTDTEGYSVPAAGRYKVTVEARPYQATSPVTLTVFKGKEGVAAAAALTELIGSFDLVDDEMRTLEVVTFLRPGDVVSPSVADLKKPEGDYVNYYAPENNVRDYKGEGIAIRSLAVEGPLRDAWPPASTLGLLGDLAIEDGAPVLTKEPYAHIQDIVADFAARAFRRPPSPGEVEAYASLAQPLLEEGESFLNALRVPLRAVLSSPSFLFHASAEPTLDEHALATRLSYFLWRSMPDDELFAVAAEGRLSDPAVMAEQVERMLADAKSERFVKDFAGQAFRLYEMNATTPDAGLYPEFDERLGQAMVAETELFLARLIGENLGAANLVAADFTFVNRRLAEHYGLAGIEGQHMRRVALPEDSVRGGLLSQASIHKITANGTTTSPVPRGNFVLANVLGQPAPPPPPNVAGLEPDTRGTTTIREQLAAHRSNPMCASCHVTIDPPGLAMESFDPIGGFRKVYRASGEEVLGADGQTYPGPYKQGLPVDASGVTPEGEVFAGFEEYREFLVREKLEDVAQHFVSQLLVLATGAEVQFADREARDRIVAKLAGNDYPVRSMIHEVAQSDLFRRQ
ncbi:MAG: DUF1592 domain-containing protein [Gammaproteobacteria bacterium]|nr:DUF1592 domain-containing protein [Gammaproteobacteria bacterium]